MIEIQCPNCRRQLMEPLWDTEWTDGRTRTVDVLCSNCLHRETLFLTIARNHKQERDSSN